MNKTINSTIAAIIVISSAFFTSCSLHIEKRGEQKEIEKTFTTSEFKGIKSNSNVKIHYTVSDTVTIMAKGPEDLVNSLTIVTGRDSLLHISQKEELNPRHFVFNFDDEEECTLYITGPSISSLNINGNTEFECESTLNSDELAIHINGAGDIKLDSVVVNNFDTHISGAAEIGVKALKSDNARFSSSGSGEVKTKLIDVKMTKIEISGAGDIEADFDNCDVADIRVSGAGDLKLSGNLRQLNKNISGAADIDDKNLTIKQ